MQEIQELQRQIDEYEKIEELHSEGHLKYVEIVKKEEAKRTKKNNPLDEYLGPIEGADELFEATRYKEYEDKIPKEIINEHIAWINAANEASRLSSQIASLEAGAEKLAETELNQLAWLKRNIATGIWCSLVLLTGGLAFIMLRSNINLL